MRNRASTKNIYFVDANVIMYASGAPHPLKQICIDLLNRTALGEPEMKTSVAVIQEILHRYSLTGRRINGIDLSRETLKVFNPVLPVDPKDIRYAMDLLKKYNSLRSRDAIHAAVALNNGIRNIVSTDHHFDTVKEIKRVDPAEFA